ncbi:lipopolysaccharide transport periplasmic protein LptA [Dokdonella sp. MW10]|uniref:lipopolysaccharide transport periplasmic protein LptA n=1 Tax=Dokdonella sp. MW10 TaxID=2992926 RepID=UPI003F812455
MSRTPSSRTASAADRAVRVLAPCLLLILASAPAFALSSDREQELKVRANHQKSMLGGTRNPGGEPDHTLLTGAVSMVQGSLKARGDQARIFDVSAPDADTAVRRLVLTGAPARMEQRLDDGGSMSAQAATIDYNDGTGIAELTGDVVVIQEGKSQFRGPHMVYNTNTGAMEGGSSEGSGGQVELIFKPKPKQPPKAPGGTP